MKKLFNFYTILSVILFLLPLYAKSYNTPFKWADDEDGKPMIYRNASGKAEGIFYDVVSEVFKRMNIPLQCRLYPWSRAQKMVLDGKADGMVTVYTKDRQKFLKATNPIIIVDEHIFANRNNPKIKEILNIKSIKELKRYIIVETIGSGWTKEHIKGAKIIWVTTPQSAVSMVALGRADIYLMSNYSGSNFIRDQLSKKTLLNDKFKDIVISPYPLAKIEYRLLIREDSSYVDIIGLFNKTLSQMHKDGTYKNIIKRYQSSLVRDLIK